MYTNKNLAMIPCNEQYYIASYNTRNIISLKRLSLVMNIYTKFVI